MLNLPVYARSGIYYFHTRVGGKQIKRSLATRNKVVAIIEASKIMEALIKIDLSGTCAVGLWVWGVRKFNISKTTLLIKPKEGLIFGGKQLPFSEIQSIGTMNETTGRIAKGTAYVYANSHGQQIKVTSYVPLALADAISEEIKSSSGIEWK